MLQPDWLCRLQFRMISSSSFSDPTRITENSSTLIDLVFVNNEHRVVQSRVIHSSLSDHSIVFCIMEGGVRKVPARTCESRSFKNYDKSAFLKDLASLPWNIVDTTDCVDDAVYLWERMFNGVADDHAPIRIRRRKGHKTPWVTAKLSEIRRDRDYHHKKARPSNSEYHWSMYRKTRNYANHEEKRLKSQYFCNLINESSSDGTRMWKTLKQVFPNSKANKDVQSIKFKGKLFTKLEDYSRNF